MAGDCTNYVKEYEKLIEKTGEIKELRVMSDSERQDAFYRSLEFGTGGLHGVMGLGANRMNVYTVRRATQGLGNEILDCGEAYAEKGVVTAHDSRNNSHTFAL